MRAQLQRLKTILLSDTFLLVLILALMLTHVGLTLHSITQGCAP